MSIPGMEVSPPYRKHRRKWTAFFEKPIISTRFDLSNCCLKKAQVAERMHLKSMSLIIKVDTFEIESLTYAHEDRHPAS